MRSGLYPVPRLQIHIHIPDPEAAEQNHITKTALVVVGDCLDTDYQLSKLYDASFSTEFRQASKKNG